jgi:hypothetical protein
VELPVRRREFLFTSAGTAGLLIPWASRASKPCPPPQVGVTGGTSASTPCAASKTYTTNFPLTENPISEGSAWTSIAPELTRVQTELIGGIHVAHGTQQDSDTHAPYDDSVATLTGFPQDHSIQGTVWVSPSITATPNREIELHLRWSEGHPPVQRYYGVFTVTGYEININQADQYFYLYRFGEQNPLAGSSVNVGTPKTGDVFYAQITTNPDGSARIIVKWNGVTCIDFTDTTPILGGNPGIGFYRDAGAPNNQYGFSSITATGL